MLKLTGKVCPFGCSVPPTQLIVCGRRYYATSRSLCSHPMIFSTAASPGFLFPIFHSFSFQTSNQLANLFATCHESMFLLQATSFLEVNDQEYCSTFCPLEGSSLLLSSKTTTEGAMGQQPSACEPIVQENSLKLARLFCLYQLDIRALQVAIIVS